MIADSCVRRAPASDTFCTLHQPPVLVTLSLSISPLGESLRISSAIRLMVYQSCGVADRNCAQIWLRCELRIQGHVWWQQHGRAGKLDGVGAQRHLVVRLDVLSLGLFVIVRVSVQYIANYLLCCCTRSCWLYYYMSYATNQWHRAPILKDHVSICTRRMHFHASTATAVGGGAGT